MMERSGTVGRCIDACQECHAVCVETILHCLKMGGRHAEATHLRLMRDCADLCAQSVELMLRGSEFMGRFCALCADVCDRCAESCEGFRDDETMDHCAKTCRDCARACREMSAT